MNFQVKMPVLSNPIATGRTARVFAWQEDQVIKVFHDWVPDDWVTHELQIARLVHSTGLDVPAVIGGIVEVDGLRGICYQRLEGDSMLEHIAAHPFTLFTRAGLLGELHAEMHTRYGIGLPSQREKLYYKITNADPLPNRLKDAALLALEKLPEGDRVCHGDFHPGNILITPRGPVTIDWTDAACGNPLSDVARTFVLLLNAQLPLNTLFGWLLKLSRKSMLNNYTHEYFRVSQLDRFQLKAWIPVVAAARLNEQIPEENERLLNIVRNGFKKNL